MALGVNTNLASISAQNQLNKSQNLSNEAMQRLSSGLRINSAKDDAAGLAISTRLDAQVRGMSVAQRNTNDGISMIQTAEGALNETINNLQRMRELAVQSANGSNSADERAALQAEIDQRIDEIDRVAKSTSFNGISLLLGDAANGATASAGDLTVNFQVGAGDQAFDQISADFADMRASVLGTSGGTMLNALKSGQAAELTDGTRATAAITVIDDALDQVNDQRSTFGAVQNRFESALNTLATSIENASASNSRILDADFASETAKMSKANVLQQAGISVLSQANARPNQVLSLLQ